MDKIETINFHEEKEVNGIKFWCYNAGHVLGAAMFMIGTTDSYWTVRSLEIVYNFNESLVKGTASPV
jgi:Cft2 family RNA processing exonuclease